MIHIIQPLAHPYGGTEIRALNLYKVLQRHTTTRLWSEFDPDPKLKAEWSVQLIRPKRLAFPKFGTFVFCGACWYVGPWLDASFPRRIIVLHNYPHDSYKDWFRRARSPWLPKIEWLFASEQMREATELDGMVEPSPIDLETFKPSAASECREPFTVGRLSRDVAVKFHEDDCELFVSLAEAGVRVRIMGGLVLRDRLPDHPLIEVLPAGAEAPDTFLHSLDVFLYRTRSDWFEAFGRVVLEAMACGLPVVCGARGGYTERIAHERNGFVFESNDQARESIVRLRGDPKLYSAVAAQARQTAVELYGEGLPREIIDFYLR